MSVCCQYFTLQSWSLFEKSLCYIFKLDFILSCDSVIFTTRFRFSIWTNNFFFLGAWSHHCVYKPSYFWIQIYFLISCQTTRVNTLFSNSTLVHSLIINRQTLSDYHHFRHRCLRGDKEKKLNQSHKCHFIHVTSSSRASIFASDLSLITSLWVEFLVSNWVSFTGEYTWKAGRVYSWDGNVFIPPPGWPASSR